MLKKLKNTKRTLRSGLYRISSLIRRGNQKHLFSEELKKGGSLGAAKMLKKAITASYLPERTRRKEIIYWANQVRKHSIAAQVFQRGGSYYAIKEIPKETQNAINRETKGLINRSLRQAGLDPDKKS